MNDEIIDLTDGARHEEPAVEAEAVLESEAVLDDAALENAALEDAGLDEDAAPADEPFLPSVPLAQQLEALLMVTDQPMPAVDIATLLMQPLDTVEQALEALAAQYREQERGFDLRNVADGWRYYSAAHCAEVVTKYATDGRSAKLTQAALETLAVVAYKQPVSRARVGAIRAVNVDGVMRTLLTRGLVGEAATDPATGAVLYGTTPHFLERMGLRSIDELPPIEDHLPDMSVLDELVDPAF